VLGANGASTISLLSDRSVEEVLWSRPHAKLGTLIREIYKYPPKIEWPNCLSDAHSYSGSWGSRD